LIRKDGVQLTVTGVVLDDLEVDYKLILFEGHFNSVV